MTRVNRWQAVRQAYLEWLRERQALDGYIMMNADPPRDVTEVRRLLEQAQAAGADFTAKLSEFVAEEKHNAEG